MADRRPIHRLASSRMARLKPSLIRNILTKAWRMEEAGREVIHLGIGRPDFDTPEPIKQAAARALEQGRVHYTHARGIAELRQALARDAGTRLGVEVDPEEEVIVTAGSSNALMTCLTALLEPGDEILTPEPAYLFYRDWGEPLGAPTRSLPLSPEQGFQLDYATLKEALTPRTKVVLINSPHNPTGSGLGRASLEALARVARENDLIVISDEVYDKIVYPPFEHLSPISLPGMKERTVVVNSFSKPYAMDGWRIGYLIAPAGLAEEMEHCHHRNAMCANTFAQYGALEALSLGPAVYEPMLGEYLARRDLGLALLAGSDRVEPFPPQGAFYLWLRLTREGADDLALAEDLLEKTGVALTPGVTFGPAGRGHLRISFAAPRDVLTRGLELLLNYLEKN